MGKGLLKLLNGMYSFAIWDGDLERLTLVRDPYGKKPLLYYINKKNIIFASDLKSLECIKIDNEINPIAIESLFRFRFIHDPYTIYKNINKLPAGHLIEFNTKGYELEKWYKNVQL